MKAILLSATVILCSALTLAAADKKKDGKLQAFKNKDTNGDGFISKAEYLNSAPRRQAVKFKEMDTNGDGRLTLEEFRGD